MELRGVSIYEVLPVFKIKCAYILVEFLAPRTNSHVDNRQVVEKVLRSDEKRFSAELAAAGKSSKQDVIKKYKLLVSERTKVGD